MTGQRPWKKKETTSNSRTAAAGRTLGDISHSYIQIKTPYMPKNLNTSAVLTWMKELKHENPNFLFRGQNREYNTISPSMFRENETKQLAVLKLCVEIHKYSSGITGYRLNNSLEELGLLQHYLELSPMLDLTGTPEVALYFSLLKHHTETPQIIYAFDQSDLKENGLEIVNHDFLLLPIDQKGYQCRWIMQDGYGVCLKDWRNLESSKNFNLLDYKHQKFIFNVGEIELKTAENLGNLLDVKEDRVAERIFNILYMLSENLNIQDVISKELNRYGFTDPKKSLDTFINSLILIAKRKNIYIEELNNLKKANNENYWDTSFDVALEFYENKLKG